MTAVYTETARPANRRQPQNRNQTGSPPAAIARPMSPRSKPPATHPPTSRKQIRRESPTQSIGDGRGTGTGRAPPAATGRLTRRGKRHPDEPAAADPERETNTQLENRPRTGTTARRSCSATSSTTAATAAVSYVDRPPRRPATTTEPEPNGLTASDCHPGPCPLG